MESKNLDARINNIEEKDYRGNVNFFSKSASIFDNDTSPIRHLNDFDSDILQKDAYKEVKDDILKIEYKINSVENDIKELDNKIQLAYDVNDFAQVKDLTERKVQLNKRLKELMETYDGASLSAKISGGITANIKESLGGIKNFLGDITLNVLSKVPGKLSTFAELRSALKKLENINKSVDELMSLQIPYGESAEKYAQLSSYITKANNISSQISRHFSK